MEGRRIGRATTPTCCAPSISVASTRPSCSAFTAERSTTWKTFGGASKGYEQRKYEKTRLRGAEKNTVEEREKHACGEPKRCGRGEHGFGRAFVRVRRFRHIHSAPANPPPPANPAARLPLPRPPHSALPALTPPVPQMNSASSAIFTVQDTMPDYVDDDGMLMSDDDDEGRADDGGDVGDDDFDLL